MIGNSARPGPVAGITVDSLARLLLDHPARPEDLLVCTVDQQRTARQFRQTVDSTAQELVAAGVQPGHAVAVQHPDPVEMAAGMFATWLVGAVFVPINSRQPAREVDRVFSSLRPAALLGPKGQRALSDPFSYDLEVAFVTWTSGTTGPPKPILQTHSGYREILARVLSSIRKTDNGTRPSPNLVPVSLALNAGIYNLLFAFMAGAAVVLMERFDPVDFAMLVSRYAVRSTVLPPAAMTMLTESPAVTDLAPLRYVRSITAPLSPLAARRFMEKFGATVLNGYGQSEIGEVIGWTAADARSHPEKLGAAGRPHAGVAIKVVGDDGQGVPAGTPGQLLVRPPRMAAGYASGESMADRTDPEGFLYTGDYAVVDEDGFVWIEGRVSDLINRGGNKVFPDEVEEVLRLAEGVDDAAVVGVADDRLGEVPVAFIVGQATDDELSAVCRQHLSPYKIPVAFRRVTSIPRSEVGKILRRRLADSLVNREGGEP